MKTIEEILTLATTAYPFDNITVENGEVRFCERFDSFEGDEPHDIAWELGISISEAMQDAGLRVKNKSSDNDSVWGKIVEATS